MPVTTLPPGESPTLVVKRIIVHTTPFRPRILLIEDDAGRIQRVGDWLLGTEFVLVAARSGGQAMGVLRRGAEGVAGLMLDHDLSNSALTVGDGQLSGTDLLPLIQRVLPRCVPVMIHSHSISKPPVMQRVLEQAGFSITRTRFHVLEEEPLRFAAWLDDVRDAWELQQP